MISNELIVKATIEDFKELKKDDNDLTYTRLFNKFAKVYLWGYRHERILFNNNYYFCGNLLIGIIKAPSN